MNAQQRKFFAVMTALRLAKVAALVLLLVVLLALI